ncbi:MAG: alpha/beta hydrolase [Dehalococcoidia bacterium]|nr:alpha/beta hydrolase [Dehalococcoidia bacterium]
MNTGSDTFESSGGTTIFEQWWRPATETRAVLAICHGYAEHSGRYAEVARYLVERGYTVEALDLRGHGRSSGERVTIKSYDDYHDDLATFLDRVRGRNPGKRVFLLGHSMGGGVVVSYLLMRGPALDGILLSGAAMLSPRPAPNPDSPPRRREPLPSSTISRDPAVVAAYDSDPLVYRGAPNPGSFSASQPAYERVQAEMERITVPLLIMHGTGDLLVPFHGSEILAQRASSNDKTLKLYPGLYHEILNEPERFEVLADVVAWLDART